MIYVLSSNKQEDLLINVSVEVMLNGDNSVINIEQISGPK